MFDAANAIAERKRGRQPMFVGDRLRMLSAYLAQPGSTLKGAAQLFGCSESTIEKTLAKLRRQAALSSIEISEVA